MDFPPQLQFLENIPGVVPKNPYEYLLDQNSRDSQAALMFSFGYGNFNHGISSSINFIKDKFRLIQLGKEEPSNHMQEIIEIQKKHYLDRREANMTYALMIQDSGKSREGYRIELGDRVDRIVDLCFQTGKLSPEDAKILFLYFSGGDSLSIEQVSSEYFKQRCFGQGKHITKALLQNWMDAVA